MLQHLDYGEHPPDNFLRPLHVTVGHLFESDAKYLIVLFCRSATFQPLNLRWKWQHQVSELWNAYSWWQSSCQVWRAASCATFYGCIQNSSVWWGGLLLFCATPRLIYKHGEKVARIKGQLSDIGINIECLCVSQKNSQLLFSLLYLTPVHVFVCDLSLTHSSCSSSSCSWSNSTTAANHTRCLTSASRLICCWFRLKMQHIWMIYSLFAC